MTNAVVEKGSQGFELHVDEGGSVSLTLDGQPFVKALDLRIRTGKHDTRAVMEMWWDWPIHLKGALLPVYGLPLGESLSFELIVPDPQNLKSAFCVVSGDTHKIVDLRLKARAGKVLEVKFVILGEGKGKEATRVKGYLLGSNALLPSSRYKSKKEGGE